jgi:hypothetical protein
MSALGCGPRTSVRASSASRIRGCCDRSRPIVSSRAHFTSRSGAAITRMPSSQADLGMLGYVQGNKPYFYHLSAARPFLHRSDQGSCLADRAVYQRPPARDRQRPVRADLERCGRKQTDRPGYSRIYRCRIYTSSLPGMDVFWRIACHPINSWRHRHSRTYFYPRLENSKSAQTSD